MNPNKTATVNVRIQENIKLQAEAILEEIGLPRSTAIDLFYRQIILTGGIPFPLVVPKNPLSIDDLSYEEVREILSQGIQQVKKGQTIDAAAVFSEMEQKFNLRK